MIQGIQLKIVLSLMKATIFLVALRHLKSWRKTLAAVTQLKEQIKKYKGPNLIRKMVLVNGQYHWDMYGSGWPGKGFVRNVKRECDRVTKPIGDHVGMRNILFAITTKCPLQCEHCFEWNNLNTKEKLSFLDLKATIEKLVKYGVGQIHLSGGEPMMRYEEIVKLLRLYSHQVGFWLLTSGFHLTPEKARTLKAAGLSGVCISIDHFDQIKHDAFRHYDQSFNMAKQAAYAAKAAGLVTALSLCATKEFVSEVNFQNYFLMARTLGVSFVQILEPKAVGHYANKAVQLNNGEQDLLANFSFRINNQNEFNDYPIVIYHEKYKKTLGCRGAGNGAFYIDPLGTVYPCPFCRASAGNIVNESVETCVSRLWAGGCTMSNRVSILKVEKEDLLSV